MEGYCQLEYRYEKITQADLSATVTLLQSVYPDDRKITYEYIQWLYFENNSGDVIGFNAKFQGEAVAHYAVIPYLYRPNIRAGHSVNTATLKKHGGRGLFTKLAELTYEKAFNDGLGFISGVANKNSIYGFEKKLGFEKVGNVKLTFMLKTMLTAKICEKLAFHSNLNWRLKNPSQKYYVSTVGDFNFIFCKRSGLFVLLGTSSEDISGLSYTTINTPYLFLLPNFNLGDGYTGLSIPNFVLPSPWHVILLANTTIPADYCLTGLMMDTF